MRIGMLADTYKPYISGVTNVIDLSKRYLESEGHEVFVFTFGDDTYEDDEENIIRSPGPNTGWLHSSRSGGSRLRVRVARKTAWGLENRVGRLRGGGDCGNSGRGPRFVRDEPG